MALHIDITNIVTIAVIAVLILLLFLLLLARHRRRSEYQINKALKPLTRAEVKNIIIPDGIGGLLEVEHLILTEHGLLLIAVYPIHGDLFGGDKIDQWTQIVKGRSYKFANPLRHIRTAYQALKSLAPNIPIEYRIIFTADARFPKGKPEHVALIASLSKDMASLQSGPIMLEPAQQAWDRILRIARTAERHTDIGEEI